MFFFQDKNDVIQELRDAIRRRRVELRLRQVDLAKKSGVPLATLNLFERTGKISLESFIKLLISLDIDRQVVKSLRAATITEPTTMKAFLSNNSKRRVDVAQRYSRTNALKA